MNRRILEVTRRFQKGVPGILGESPSKKQVNVRVIPTSQAINESVDLAHEIFNRVFRKVPERIAR